MRNHVRLPGILLCAVLAAMSGCSKKTPPEQLAADSLFAAARSLFEEGSYGRSHGLVEEALGYDRPAGRTFRCAEEYSLLGRIAEARAEFDTAREYYSRSAQEYRALAQRDSVRALLLVTAALHRRMGEDRKAFAQLEEGLRLARVFGDSAGVREIEYALLPLCRLLEDWEMEGRIVNDLLKAYGSPPDPGRLAPIYFEVASSQAFRREYDRAAEHFLRAYTFADQARDSLLAIRSLLRLAMVFDAAGRVSETFQSYSDGLKRAGLTAGAGSLRAEFMVRIGNAYLRSRVVDQARRFFNAGLAAAIQRSNKLLEGYCVVQLGVCDLSSTPDASVKQAQSAVALFEAAGYDRGVAYANDLLGAALDRSGRYTEALGAYRASIRSFERLRSIPGRNEIAADCEATYHGHGMPTPYDDAVDVLLRTGAQEEAFLTAERRQSWVILSQLGGTEIAGGDTFLAQALAEYRNAEAARVGAEARLVEVLSNLARNSELLGAVRRALESAAKHVEEKADAVVRLRPQLEPFVRVRARTLAELQQRIPPGAVLVEYVPARRTLTAFALHNGRTSVQLASIDRDRLMLAAQNLDGMLRRAEARGDSVSRMAPVAEPGSAELFRLLYEAFVRPVEGELRENSRALFVLPFELGSVPIHALRRNSLPGTPFLGEQIAISYLPAAAWLRADVPVVGAAQEIAAMGYPGGTGWDVEYELRDIRAFYKDARLSFGAQASPAMLEQGRADVLHLAVDVRYNPAAPWNAAVMLSDPKSAALSVRFSLGRFAGLTSYRSVVLSNLSPGLANVHVLLASSILSGGASTVVVSSMTPSRKAKKVFSEIFYTALLGGADVQAALHRLQTEMIRNPEFSSPLVWGSYMAWGQ